MLIRLKARDWGTVSCFNLRFTLFNRVWKRVVWEQSCVTVINHSFYYLICPLLSYIGSFRVNLELLLGKKRKPKIQKSGTKISLVRITFFFQTVCTDVSTKEGSFVYFEPNIFVILFQSFYLYLWVYFWTMVSKHYIRFYEAKIYIKLSVYIDYLLQLLTNQSALIKVSINNSSNQAARLLFTGQDQRQWWYDFANHNNHDTLVE